MKHDNYHDYNHAGKSCFFFQNMKEGNDQSRKKAKNCNIRIHLKHNKLIKNISTTLAFLKVNIFGHFMLYTSRYIQGY